MKKKKRKRIGFYKTVHAMDKHINPFFNREYFAQILSMAEAYTVLSQVAFKNKGGKPCPVCKTKTVVGKFVSGEWEWNSELRHMILVHGIAPSNAFCRKIAELFSMYRFEKRAGVEGKI